MKEKKRLSRQEMRQRIRILEKDVEQLTARLVETTKELKLHAMWCGMERPHPVKAFFNRIWVSLTERFSRA